MEGKRATKVDQGSIRYQLSGKPLDKLPDLRLHPYKEPPIPGMGLSPYGRIKLEEVYIDPYFNMPVMFDVENPRFVGIEPNPLLNRQPPAFPAILKQIITHFGDPWILLPTRTRNLQF